MSHGIWRPIAALLSTGRAFSGTTRNWIGPRADHFAAAFHGPNVDVMRRQASAGVSRFYIEDRNMRMRSVYLVLASLTMPVAAHAGCATGAAVGGVAGHVAGHHAVLGAAAGCVIGHHNAVKRRREAQAQAQAQSDAARNPPAPPSAPPPAPPPQD
jgi:hypothetical protein